MTKLSKRIRRDCEAAPWVIDEVIGLEDEVERLSTEVKDRTAERDDLFDDRAAILKKLERVTAEAKSAFEDGYLAGAAEASENDFDVEHIQAMASLEWAERTAVSGSQECDHEPITYTKHPSGDIATKCRKCMEPLDSADSRQERDYESLYYELLFQVEKKFPGETRHETAKRYIIERETPDPNACASAEKGQ